MDMLAIKELALPASSARLFAGKVGPIWAGNCQELANNRATKETINRFCKQSMA